MGMSLILSLKVVLWAAILLKWFRNFQAKSLFPKKGGKARGKGLPYQYVFVEMEWSSNPIDDALLNPSSLFISLDVSNFLTNHLFGWHRCLATACVWPCSNILLCELEPPYTLKLDIHLSKVLIIPERFSPASCSIWHKILPLQGNNTV